MSRHPRIPSDDNAETTTLFSGKWLTLKARGRWEFVERNSRGGAVIIIAAVFAMASRRKEVIK